MLAKAGYGFVRSHRLPGAGPNHGTPPAPLCAHQPHFYSTMNPSRNPYILLKTNDRCTFYSTVNLGVSGATLGSIPLAPAQVAAPNRRLTRAKLIR